MNIRSNAVGMLVVTAALLWGAGLADAARPARGARAPARVARAGRVQTIDTDRRIDVNNLNMFVANNGAFGYDLGGNYNGGLFYPNHTANTAIYAAGLWIGAVVEPDAFITKWGSAGAGNGQFSAPRGIGIEADSVYVADAGNNRIQLFDVAGNYLTKWGTPGAGNGQFNNPRGVGVRADFVYVVDAGNNRIQMFDAAGAYLTQWGAAGNGNGQFSGPTGVALDAAGNVYVADTGNDRIQKFDGLGAYLTQWGAAGNGNGQFSGPTGISADAAGNVYVADTGNNRIQHFDGSGTFVAKWGTLGAGDGEFSGPTGVSVDVAGNVYATDTGNNRIQKFDAAGAFLLKWGSAGGGDGQFNAASNVATSAVGNVYVADTGNNRVQRFNGTGPETRLAVAEYDQEFVPGRIIGGAPEPDNSDLVVYKVKRWTGVPSDSAHVDNPNYNFDRGEDPLVHHSWSEYVNGAKPYGAPTKMYTLPGPGGPVVVEGPDVTGDQMLWCVYNDADPVAHANEAGSTAPLGIQIEQTTFAFDRLGALGNTIFVKYRITNKGPYTLKQMYISQWSDVDLGQFTDDLVGCDTLPDLNGHPRSLGFAYNGSNRDDLYGDIPPALGIDFLQGPIVPPGDTLGLSSFAKYINGTDPLAAQESYDWMRGLDGLNSGAPIVDPLGNVTHYMVAGDPLLPSAANWVDSNPADRRFFLSSGPLDMSPGQSQDVVVAIMVGQCGDRLQSIKALKFADDAAQEAYDLGFDVAKIPAPPPTPIVAASHDHGSVTLNWDTAALTATLEPGYKIEGYNVYQGSTIAGPWKLVAVYDSVNTIQQVFDKKFIDGSCEFAASAAVAYGADVGLRDYHITTQDFVRGTSLKDATTYYYAVTAYGVNLSATANKVLESPRKAVEAMPQRLTSAVTPSMIRVVPNPYYAHSSYEQSQFSRRVRFINMPAQCTVRIYNLAGQLVRTLEKNDPSTSVLEWDIETRNGLPVGSGVYIYHVATPGGSDTVGRLVVFMEKERLNNF